MNEINRVDIQKAISRARIERLNSIDNISSENNPLAGVCAKNALQLAKELEKYNPQIARGAFEIDGKIPKNFEEAVKIGQQHFWVIVSSDKEEFHIDISAEYPPETNLNGKPLIRNTCPRRYKLFDRVKYNKGITVETLKNI